MKNIFEKFPLKQTCINKEKRRHMRKTVNIFSMSNYVCIKLVF